MNSREAKSIAPIDRHIRVVNIDEDAGKNVRRVSELRHTKYVVLLGEPGIGKSTVLEAEARFAGLCVHKSRTILTGDAIAEESMLFIDALDEYRSDGQSSDKIHELARVIRRAKPKGWRIACRSEDWRKDADLAAIASTTDGSDIVVVQLLPLVGSEMIDILTTLGEQAPSEFLEKAESLGAQGFLESPLSLTLLHKATIERGAWPASRFQLFEAGAARLAYEDNAEHKFNDRRGHQDILTAAGTVCLLLLMTGARALWLSNGPVPDEFDKCAYLEAQQCGIAIDLLHATLDTALFRGEGEAFEPIHRSVAEFLAAQALAGIVSGDIDRAALPVSRALALLTGSDGVPATEMRGLYGWFATQLAFRHRHDDADFLVATDALTVLLYGDASVFSTNTKVAMLRAVEEHATTPSVWLGGITGGALACDDLVPEFQRIIETDHAQTDESIIVVYDILLSGKELSALSPVYKRLALSPSRPKWQRSRAIKLWLRTAEEVNQQTKEIFDAVEREPISSDRAQIRLDLLPMISVSLLTAEDVRAVLGDYERDADDRALGDLTQLQEMLVKNPLPEMFEVPALSWRPREDEEVKSEDIDTVIDHALAAVISAAPSFNAMQIWRWVRNSRKSESSSSGGEMVLTIRYLIKQASARAAELFCAMVLSEPVDDPGNARFHYMTINGSLPEDFVLTAVLSKVVSDGRTYASLRLLDAITPSIKNMEGGIDCYWRVYKLLNEWEEIIRLGQFASSPYEDWRINRREHKIERAQQRAEERAERIANLTPVLDELRSGSRCAVINQAAKTYLSHKRDDNVSNGVSRIEALTDPAIASAFVDGFVQLAMSIGDEAFVVDSNRHADHWWSTGKRTD